MFLHHLAGLDLTLRHGYVHNRLAKQCLELAQALSIVATKLVYRLSWIAQCNHIAIWLQQGNYQLLLRFSQILELVDNHVGVALGYPFQRRNPGQRVRHGRWAIGRSTLRARACEVGGVGILVCVRGAAESRLR